MRPTWDPDIGSQERVGATGQRSSLLPLYDVGEVGRGGVVLDPDSFAEVAGGVEEQSARVGLQGELQGVHQGGGVLRAAGVTGSLVVDDGEGGRLGGDCREEQGCSEQRR